MGSARRGDAPSETKHQQHQHDAEKNINNQSEGNGVFIDLVQKKIGPPKKKPLGPHTTSLFSNPPGLGPAGAHRTHVQVLRVRMFVKTQIKFYTHPKLANHIPK
ncbi:uncharacterized protein UV8b_07279 [Ustilaginoidea virens]|uniref:Uncharacterized protein n=1 Tax=Ustilaginoidea virens TaxID=1159556 RepID=A0A8E5HWV8_USTVR|nr:uncharacterized protein UV8b_07279 [Ustilaginoidea virens]QUC23038.1 hypothetical protein UV8b_07279 [Ustilaginoidea virens]